MEDQSDACRLCGSQLQGSQRRWLFHRASQRPDLRVLLAHVCREAPCRGDGRGEFLCGKCAQALGRVFRFDAVIARVQALSLERLQRLLEEKERLARCLRHLHAHRSPQASLPPSPAGTPQLLDAPYQRLLQDDMAVSGLECWAEPGAGGSPCQNRWCPSCHGLRVPDADYEWVCGTPRQLGASSPALPLCRDKSQSMPLVLRAGLGGPRGHGGSLLSLRAGSIGSCSLLSLDSLAGPEPLGEALRALRGIGQRALRVPRGSRIPVLAERAAPSGPPREMEEEEEEEQEEEEEELEDEFVPLGVKTLGGLRGRELTGRLAAAEEELRSLRAKTGCWATEDAGVPSGEGPGPGRSRERLLGALARGLHSKEAALQDCLAALESLAPPGAEPPAPESLAPHFCGRLKERDRALERTLADQFLALEQEQQERGRLQGALQDQDRELGRLAAALRTGERTLHALREMLEQKELERGQLASLCAMAHDAWHRQDQTRALALKEMEELVAALQAALASSTRDLEVLAESLDAPGPGLLQRLQEQGQLLAEALAERARLAAEMEARLQGALVAQAAAVQQLQDQLRGCTQALAERAREAGALRGRLARQEGVLAERAAALVQCRGELARLRGLLEERDHALVKAAREAEEKDRWLQKLQAPRCSQDAGGMKQTL